MTTEDEEEEGAESEEGADKRETITGAVPDMGAAEAVVTRLARLAVASPGVSIRVRPLRDDPATPEIESGLSVTADVPAAGAADARKALCGGAAERGERGEDGGEGGI